MPPFTWLRIKHKKSAFANDNQGLMMVLDKQMGQEVVGLKLGLNDLGVGKQIKPGAIIKFFFSKLEIKYDVMKNNLII